MFSDNSNILLLVTKLTEKTMQGKIHWKKGVVFNSFMYHMEKVSISLNINASGEKTVVSFNILDETGMVIETYSELYQYTQDDYDNPVSFLYNIARRKALNIDETIDSVITHISDL